MDLEWRLEELRQIDAELDGPERKAALCALLDQEAQLIASIGRHKLEASKDSKEKNIERFLGKVRCWCTKLRGPYCQPRFHFCRYSY